MAHTLRLLQQLPSISTGRADELVQQEEMQSQQPSTSAAVSTQGLLPSQYMYLVTLKGNHLLYVWVWQTVCVSGALRRLRRGALANRLLGRLPPLQPGVVLRAFDPEQALCREFVPTSPRLVLLSVKELLAKDSLCQKNAKKLVSSTKENLRLIVTFLKERICLKDA